MSHSDPDKDADGRLVDGNLESGRPVILDRKTGRLYGATGDREHDADLKDWIRGK